MSSWLANILKYMSIGYYNGQLHRFEFSNANVSLKKADENFKPHIIIVAREYYQEVQKNSPVTDKRELKRILALDNNNNQSNKINLPIQSTESHTQIMQWSFLPEVPAARWVIPETMVLAAYMKKRGEFQVASWQCESGHDYVYVATLQASITSSLPTSVINTLQRFCQSSGVSETFIQGRYSYSELPQHLWLGLLSLPNKYWLATWQFPTTIVNKKEGYAAAGIAITLLSSYLMGSSAYIAWQAHSLHKQLQMQEKGLTEAIRLQEVSRQLQQQVTTLNTASKEFHSSLYVWKVLLPLYPDIDLRSVSYENGRFVLRGEAEQATAILARIAKDPKVIDAKFDLPVSNSRKGERFTISFKWVASQNIASNGKLKNG